jgi:hypothetical protein
MRKAILIATCAAALVGLTALWGDTSEASTEDLLLALLREGSSAPVVHPGGLPDGLEIELPESGRLLGSAEWPDRSQIIVRFESSPAEARASLVESLESQGWELPPGKLYGFVQSQDVYSASLCREDREVLGLSIEPVGSGASSASLSYRKSLKKSPCLRSPYLGFHNEDADIFPTLVAPGGAKKWGGGGGGVGSWTKVGDSHSRATVLESAQSVPQLLEHYGAQMKQAGWKLTDQLVGEEASVQLWARSGEEGEEFFGSFVVVELSDGSVELNLRITMRRAAKPA